MSKKMKDITNSRKTVWSLYAILIILACMATFSFGSLSAEIDTDRENYCGVEEINFDAIIKLTECEQIDSQILENTHNIPSKIGWWIR